MLQRLFHHLIDIHNKRIYPAEIQVLDGKIKSISTTKEKCKTYILPGFIDAHVHIESSMLLPSAFAQIAVKHGSIATISDPHEIANVCGMEGVEFMLKNAAKVPFYFFFGAPSCVPATNFETAGARLDAKEIEKLLKRDDIYYLSEMMNYPGVLLEDAEVMQKIAIAKKYKKNIDGHAPGLRGKDAKKYVENGISTDHECFTMVEAEEKIKYGMHILIREGSAAKNFDALIPLLNKYPDKIMFCCDDKHPDELLLHHINHHVKKALAFGIDIFNCLLAACVNPVKHYNLPIGLLREGDSADFIVIDNPKNFKILETYIQGNKVFNGNESAIQNIKEEAINNFNCEYVRIEQLKILAQGTKKIKVIEVEDGQLITKKGIYKLNANDGELQTSVKEDILKIVVYNRYKTTPPAIAFVKNVGLKKGAIASTVAHDGHNIIAIGCNDKDLCKAINTLIDNKGGICTIHNETIQILPLPIAGLMSEHDAKTVGKNYATLDKSAKKLGSKLKAPFMSLSFLALLVIPSLKLSDMGLFDGEKFELTDLVAK